MALRATAKQTLTRSRTAMYVYSDCGDSQCINSDQQQPLQPPAPTRQGESNYSAMTQDSQYSTPQAAGVPANGVPAAQAGGMATGSQAPMQQAAPTVLSNQDFLARVEAAKADIRQLTQYISEIASAHQRTLNSPDASTNQALESIVTQTQVLNTSIKDQIKFLETDAARSGRNNNIKNSQVGQLKTSFKKQLEEYRNEEASYERRYREQIARQYRIVNPEATDAEVQEASNADWGNEGVFQTAVCLPSANALVAHANSVYSSRPTVPRLPAPSSVLCVLVTTTFSRLSVL